MCTSLTFTAGGAYAGRTLDLEYDFGQEVVITPRGHKLTFHSLPPLEEHYAMIGMAHVAEDQALYAEAANEKGVYLAGLNFPGSACYPCPGTGAQAAPYELFWWLLGSCATAREAVEKLTDAQITDEPFRPELPLAPLHWHLADARECFVVEPLADGLHIYPDPVGVLTNEPPYPFQRTELCRYLNLTPRSPECRFAPDLELTPYGQGMGALGLPGDASPTSRYVRAAFHRHNSSCGAGKGSAVAQFFRVLDSVSMVRGSVLTPQGQPDYTRYASCIDLAAGDYYFRGYEDSGICLVHMGEQERQGRQLLRFPVGRRWAPRSLN